MKYRNAGKEEAAQDRANRHLGSDGEVTERKCRVGMVLGGARVHTHRYTWTHTQTCKHTDRYTQTHADADTGRHRRKHTQTHTHPCAVTHSYTPSPHIDAQRTNAQTLKYKHTSPRYAHMHAHMYTRTHAQTQMWANHRGRVEICQIAAFCSLLLFSD